MENSKFDFIFSTRFWAMIIGALSIYLKAKGLIGEPEMMLIATITAGFVAVKTLDKNVGEAKILSAGVSTGDVQTEDVADVPPEK
jgi:hypothetical protein